MYWQMQLIRGKLQNTMNNGGLLNMGLFDLDKPSPLIKSKSRIPSFSLDGFDDSDTKREIALRAKQEEEKKKMQAIQPPQPEKTKSLGERFQDFLNFIIPDSLKVPITPPNKDKELADAVAAVVSNM